MRVTRVTTAAEMAAATATVMARFALQFASFANSTAAQAASSALRAISSSPDCASFFRPSFLSSRERSTAARLSSTQTAAASLDLFVGELVQLFVFHPRGLTTYSSSATKPAPAAIANIQSVIPRSGPAYRARRMRLATILRLSSKPRDAAQPRSGHCLQLARDRA
jgi:hypothetical protein